MRDDDLKSITSDFDKSFWWSSRGEASVERVAMIMGMGLGDK